MQPFHHKLKADSIALLALCFALMGARTILASDLPPEIEALPANFGALEVSPETWQTLQELARTTTAENIGGWIQSDEPRQLGLAIFVLSRQEDVEGLLALSRFLDDERLTIPVSVLRADTGEFIVYEQSVASLLTRTYHGWFGVTVRSSAEFDRVFAGLVDSDDLLMPWRVRLLRAKGDPERLAALKSRIRGLDPELRWAVIVQGFWIGAYSRQEAQEEARRLVGANRALADTDNVRLPDSALVGRRGGAEERMRATFADLVGQPPEP